MSEHSAATTGKVPAEKKLTVMVVDDTAVNRQILAAFLNKLNFRCVQAADGEEAVVQFERERPDIILMDVMMPGVNGYDATRRIREKSGERWVPVVFVSALDRNENLIDGLDAGGDDFMSKPINFIVLDAKLRSLARTVELQRSLEATRRRHAAITENILDGVVVINNRGIIESANRAAAYVFGYDVDEMVGGNVSMLMPMPDRDTHDQYLHAYLDGRAPAIIGFEREVTGQRKNGETFPLEIGVTEIRHEGQHLFVGILRDVTERRRVQARLRENAERLQEYRDHRELELSFAREVIERQMARPGMSDKAIRYWVLPADNLSGDIVAASRSPEDGKLYAMLADGAGHGLAAALSVVPVLTMFYSYVEGQCSVSTMIDGINRQLRAALPGGRFIAMSLLSIDDATGTADIWVGGIPALFWLGADGKVKECVQSTHLSLGIVESDADLLTVRTVNWAPGDRFVMCSDGLLESTTLSGELFGIERFVSVLESCRDPNDLMGHIRHELVRHNGTEPPGDDVSVLIVDCPASMTS